MQIPSNSFQGKDIVDYKKVKQIIRLVLLTFWPKLYEDCHHENKQLSDDIQSVRQQLQQVKHQLEGAAHQQASHLSTDAARYDKNVMDRKIIDIRNELKVKTQSGLFRFRALNCKKDSVEIPSTNGRTGL